MRPSSPRGLLGRVMRASNTLSNQGLRALLDSALDPRIPADMRMEALGALAMVGSRHPLPSDAVNRVLNAQDRGASSLLRPVPEDLLRMFRLTVLATTSAIRKTDDFVQGSRDRDPRVRQLAVEASGHLLERRESSDLEFVVVSGLFDPEEGVVSAALYSILARRKWRPATVRTISSRLNEIYETHGRTVRSLSLRAGARLVESDPLSRACWSEVRKTGLGSFATPIGKLRPRCPTSA